LKRAALALALLLAAALPASAQLVKPGEEGFKPEDLGAWQGKVVRGIELSGHKTTKEYVIRREIRVKAGEPLDIEVVRADVQRLDNLSIFAQIEVEAAEAGDGVALTYVFKEMPSWVPLVAFIYTEENGFSIGPGLSALNMTGRNVKVSARAYFGGTNQYSAKVTWPWITGNHVGTEVFAARYERSDVVRGFEEVSDEFTPEISAWLGDHGRVEGKFSYFRMRSDVDGITLTPENDDTLIRLGAVLGWDTRDSWRNPSRGWQNELEIWRTGGVLGGDGDFWSMNLDLRRWWRTAPRQKLLVSSLLSMQSGTLGTDVPYYMDYRLGGANSIRGYNVEELGLSGKNQLLGTAEYSYSLMPLRRWDIWIFALRLGVDLTVFGDVGVAWNESEEFGWRNTRAGLGSGLRLLVPGSEMMRLDVGWSPSGGFQFHFGNWSKPSGQRFRLR
jgi:outer membrane protein insertion porin family